MLRSLSLPSLPLTWHLTEGPLKSKLILQIPSHRCYVSAREGTSASIVARDASSGKEQALHGHEAVWLSFGFNTGLTSWVDPRPSRVF